MRFKIGNKIDTPRKVNAFVIEVKMMHGDADEYTTQEVIIPDNDKNKYLEKIVSTLDEMKNLPSNDARELYEKNPRFLVYFGSEYLGVYEGTKKEDENWPDEIDMKEWYEISKYSFKWEKDITCEDILAKLENYKVFYYNHKGEKHNVEILKD